MEFSRKGILDECRRIFKEEKEKGEVEFSQFKFNIASLSLYDLKLS